METVNIANTQSNGGKRHTHLKMKICKITKSQSNGKKRHHLFKIKTCKFTSNKVTEKSDANKENFDFWKLQILQIHKVTEKSDTDIWKWRDAKIQRHKHLRFKSCKVTVKKRCPQRNFWLLKTANDTNTQKFDFEKLKNIQIFGLQFANHKNWKKYLSQQVTVWGSLPWNFLFGSLYV